MKIIHGARRSGKTTQLIKEAAKKDAVILCHSAIAAKAVADRAKDMGIDIREPLTIHTARRRASYSVDKVLIDNAELVLQELIQLYTRMHIHTITINDESNTEQRYEKGDTNFSDAEVGDLIWNDAYGVGKIHALKGGAPYGGIIVDFGFLRACCTVNGKYCKVSPKATFFYFDGKGNNYLTKRPEQKIDFTTLKQGTRLKTAGGALVYFVSYMPIAYPPICVAGQKNVDGVYSDTRFLPVSAIVRVEEVE